MKTYIDYTLAASDSAIKLCELVRQLMGEGWEPQGGIFESKLSGSYIQAMVKTIEHDNDK